MSKVGELLDQLQAEKSERFPDKPVRIVVGRTETYAALMTDIGAAQILSLVDGVRLFNGVPIVAAGGRDRDFDFKIEFEAAP